jgi:integrase
VCYGAREAWNLEWQDLDTIKSIIRIKPEKHGNPRNLKVSRRLVERLLALPRKSSQIFGGTQLRTMRRVFQTSRNRIAATTKNPRLKQINFHTFRHWKATREYHRTKSPLHVMRLLGHRSIKNTMVYTHLVDFGDSDYISKVAWNVDEACKLVEAGFEYVCDVDNGKIFRKPK